MNISLIKENKADKFKEIESSINELKKLKLKYDGIILKKYNRLKFPIEILDILKKIDWKMNDAVIDARLVGYYKIDDYIEKNKN